MSVRATKTALQVLEAIGDRQPCGLSDLARHLGLPKTTVQRALVTLDECGWIKSDRVDTVRWVLGAKAFSVGSKVARNGGLKDVAMPILNRLNLEVNENVHLMMRDGDQVVLVERLDSSHAVRAYQPLGARAPLHASSNGKAVLAYLPAHEVEDYLARTLQSLTDFTTTNPDVLRAELNKIRQHGYAVAEEEYQEGVISVAAAIKPPNRELVGSLSLSAPKQRMPRARYRDYGEKVQTAAFEIASLLP